MKKIIHLALFLAIVAGLSGATLSYVHSITEPIIQDAALENVKGSLEKIYPGGTFKKLEINVADYQAIKEVFEAEGKGYIYNCSVVGYGGANTPIQYLIAIDKDGTYKGFEVLDCSGETNGFGSKVAEKPFSLMVLLEKSLEILLIQSLEQQFHQVLL